MIYEPKLKLKDLLFSFSYSIIVISICLLFYSRFFNVDDAINEMLGFYKQYGKALQNGEFPLIVDTLFFGDNSVIELSKAVFLPQTILGSLITFYFDYRITGISLALVNFILIMLSGIYIARHFKMANKYAYGFVAFLIIQPVFLYQYSAGWWNAANGQTWATVSIATFIALSNKTSLKNGILNFLSVVFLYASGWPHGIIGYTVFVLIFMAYIYTQEHSLKRIIPLCIVSVLAVLAAIPIYSEYLYSSDLITRPSGLHNSRDFLSPSIASIILGFNPTSYEYLHYFAGYLLLPIAIGFSNVFIPVILFHKRIRETIWRRREVRLFLVLTLIYFILTQLPSQIGSLRWQFRFLPFLSLAINLLTFYILSNYSHKNRRSSIFYFIFILVTSLISISTTLGSESSIILSQVIAFFILLLLPKYMSIRINSNLKYVIVAISCLIVMLLGTNTIGERYLTSGNPSQKINKPEKVNYSGFILSLTNGEYDKINLSNLNSALFGLYDIKSINGYSPVGHTNLDKLLPYSSAHGFFFPEPSLINVLKPSELDGYCQSKLMHISTIIVHSDIYAKYKNQLEQCGYTEFVHDNQYNKFYVSLPNSLTERWEHEWYTSSNKDIRITPIQHNNNQDILRIEEDIPQPISIIFPRVWWKGYSAKLNDIPLQVISDITGTLVKVNIPAGKGGTLILSYFPETWKYTLPITVSSILILCIFFLIRRKLLNNK